MSAWSDAEEADLRAAEVAAAHQWALEHADPIEAALSRARFAEAEVRHLREFIEFKGWCMPAGMSIEECNDGPCDCFIPERERQIASKAWLEGHAAGICYRGGPDLNNPYEQYKDMT